jgi:hypothetical protein
VEKKSEPLVRGGVVVALAIAVVLGVGGIVFILGKRIVQPFLSAELFSNVDSFLRGSVEIEKTA